MCQRNSCYQLQTMNADYYVDNTNSSYGGDLHANIWYTAMSGDALPPSARNLSAGVMLVI